MKTVLGINYWTVRYKIVFWKKRYNKMKCYGVVGVRNVEISPDKNFFLSSLRLVAKWRPRSNISPPLRVSESGRLKNRLRLSPGNRVILCFVTPLVEFFFLFFFFYVKIVCPLSVDFIAVVYRAKAKNSWRLLHVVETFRAGDTWLRKIAFRNPFRGWDRRWWEDVADFAPCSLHVWQFHQHILMSNYP